MSLINDALKRAQNDRNRQRADTMLGGGPTPRRQEKGPLKMILIIVLAIGFAGWGIAFLIMFTKKDSAPQVAAAPVESTIVSEPVEKVDSADLEGFKEVAVVEAKPVVEEPTPVVEKKTLIKEIPVKQPQVQRPVPVKEEPKVVVEQKPTPAIQFNEPVALPEPRTDTIKTVLKLDISAVMGEGKKCRIIVGGRVVRVGELIDYENDIRFMGKKGTTLYFTDSTKQIYEKYL